MSLAPNKNNDDYVMASSTSMAEQTSTVEHKLPDSNVKATEKRKKQGDSKMPGFSFHHYVKEKRRYMYECDNCKTQVYSHRRKIHACKAKGEKIKKEYTCSNCLRKFDRKYNLKRHVISQHGESGKKKNKRPKSSDIKSQPKAIVRKRKEQSSENENEIVSEESESKVPVPSEHTRNKMLERGQFDVVDKFHGNSIVGVVDTNVLMHFLTTFSDVCKRDDVKILIPYQLLCELNGLKKSSNKITQNLARKADNFIKNSRLTVQGVKDHERHLIDISNDNKGDDTILNCCLQVRDHVRHLFLFTNDTNLYNRATASGIEGVTPDKIILRLNTLSSGIDDSVNRTETNLTSTDRLGQTSGNDYFENHLRSLGNWKPSEKIKLRVNGEAVPSYIENFGDSGLHSLLLDKLKRKMLFKKPTPVQQFSLPIIMAKRNLIVCSPRGSGKTAAFLLPIIDGVLKNIASIMKGKPIAIILSSTSESAMQIFEKAKKISFGTIVKVCIAITDFETKPLKDECHILVATAGGLLDLIESSLSSFERIQYLVIDKADRMLKMGLVDKIYQIMEHGAFSTAENRNICLFSATLPKEIKQLAEKYLKRCIYLAAEIGK